MAVISSLATAAAAGKRLGNVVRVDEYHPLNESRLSINFSRKKQNKNKTCFDSGLHVELMYRRLIS